MNMSGYSTSLLRRMPPGQRAPTWPGGNSRPGIRSGFTVIELLVASSIGLLVMAGTMAFFQFANISLSGTTAQTLLNQQAGNTMEFIQSRVRYATSVSNDASGNVLTMSFDDNPAVDSDGDGTTYNDKDHYERFQFVGVNGSTNTTSSNRLVYIPDITETNQRVFISAGVHNLPSYNIFTTTNTATVIVRFGIVDNYVRDHYQSIDIQATALCLNHPPLTNFVGIIP